MASYKKFTKAQYRFKNIEDIILDIPIKSFQDEYREYIKSKKELDFHDIYYLILHTNWVKGRTFDEVYAVMRQLQTEGDILDRDVIAEVDYIWSRLPIVTTCYCGSKTVSAKNKNIMRIMFENFCEKLSKDATWEAINDSLASLEREVSNWEFANGRKLVITEEQLIQIIKDMDCYGDILEYFHENRRICKCSSFDTVDYSIIKDQAPDRPYSEKILKRNLFQQYIGETDIVEDQMLEVCSDLEELSEKYPHDDSEFTPINQPPVPSKAELLSDLQDYLNENRVKKIKCKRDKKQLKKRKMYYNQFNGDHRPYWKPSEQLYISNIESDTMKAYRTVSAIKTPARILASSADFSGITIEQAFQISLLFDKRKTGSDDKNSVGYPREAKDAPYKKNRVLLEHGTLQEQYDQLKYYISLRPTDYGMDSYLRTLEVLFDSLAKAASKVGTFNDAFYQLLDWMLRVDSLGYVEVKGAFKNLNPLGVLVFLSQIEKRGLYNGCRSNLHILPVQSRHLTKKERKIDFKELLELCKDPESNHVNLMEVFELPRFKEAIKYIKARRRHLKSEMNYLRYGTAAYEALYYPEAIVLITWKFFWPKHDLIEGTSEDDPQNSSPGPSCGTELECILENDESYVTSDEQSLKAESISSYPEEGTCFTKMKPDETPMIEKIKGAYAKVLRTIEEKTGIAAGIGSMYDSVLSILSRMEGFIDNIIVNITKSIDKILGISDNFVLKSMDIMYFIIAYVIFQNTEIKVLKMASVYIMLQSCGLRDIIQKGIITFYEFLTDSNRSIDEPEPVIEGTAEETAEDGILSIIYNYLFKFDAHSIGVIATIFIFGVLAYRPCKTKFNIQKIGETIVDKMKNMHFVGAGMFGCERLIKYFSGIYQVVKEKLGELIKGKQEPIDEQEDQMLKAIVYYDTKIMFYSTPNGLEQLRKSKRTFNEAQEILTKMIQMRHKVLTNPKYTRTLRDQVLRTKSDVLKLLSTLDRISISARFRNTPFHLQMYGSAGIGKSTLLHHITQEIQKKCYPDTEHGNCIYSPNNKDKYWSGYANQPVLLVDEMYPILDPEVLTEWLTLISNTPVMLPMAELSDKVTYFTSEWILSNTNVAYPRANGVACQEAVWRRRHLLIHVTCDPEVINKSSHKVDKNLLMKKYPKDKFDLNRFPHLRFSLAKPVISSNDTVNADGITYLDPNVLPGGVVEPTTNLTYDQLLTQMFNRRAVLIQEESELPQSVKNSNLLEVEMLIEELEEYYKDNNKPTKEFFKINRSNVNVLIGSLVPIKEIPEDEIVDIHMDEKGNIQTNLGFGVTEETPQQIQDKIKENVAKIEEIYITLPSIEKDKHVTFLVKYHPEDETFTINRTDGKKVSLEKMKQSTLKHVNMLLEGWEYADEFNKYMQSLIEQKIEGTSEDDDSLQEKVQYYRSQGKHKLADRIEAVLQNQLMPPKKEIAIKDPVTYRVFGYEKISQPDRGDDLYTLHDVILEPNIILEKTGVREVINTQHDFNYYCKHRKLYLTNKEIKTELWNGYEGDANNKRNTGMSLFYISKIIKVNGEYKFHFDTEVKEITARHVQPYLLGTLENRPNAMNLTCDPEFVSTIDIFMHVLNEEQKQYVLKNYSNRYRDTLSRYQHMTDNIARFGNILKEKLQKTFKVPHFMKVAFKTLKRVLYIAGISAAIVYAIKSLGELFGLREPQIEGTSKILFKKSAIVKNLVGTSQTCHENHCNRIRKNMLQVKYGTKVNNGLGIKGNCFVINKHVFGDKIPDNFEIEVKRTLNVEAEFQPYLVTKKMWRPFDGKDLIMICHSGVGSFKDILKTFRKKDEATYVNSIELIFRNSDGDGQLIINDPTLIKKMTKMDISGNRRDFDDVISYKVVPPLGSSGGPLLNRDLSKLQILGIQCYRDKTFGYACSLFQEELQSMTDKLGIGIENQGPYYVEDRISYTAELITSDQVVIGTVPDDMILGAYSKTKYVKTEIAEAKLIPPSDRIPAILNAFDSRVPENRHFLQHSVNKYGRDIMKVLDQERLDIATDLAVSYYKQYIDTDRQLEFRETIRGLPNMKCEPINLKTSPGVPFVYKRHKSGKKDYIEFDEEGEISYLDPKVEEIYNDWDNQLKEGIIPTITRYEFPKDELRPIEKVNQLKTRSISVVPFPLNLLYRKYNSYLDTQIRQTADGTNPICVGINPESLAIDRMYRKLRSMSSYGSDKDIGNWDGHFTHQLKQAVNRFRNEFIPDELTDQEKYQWILARETLSQAITHGYVQFLDTIFQSNRGLGSGYAGTTDENCIGHMILFLYFVIEILHKKLGYYIGPKIFDIVKFYIYGDDLIYSINDEFSSLLTYEEIADLYEYYGWPVSSAKKDVKVNVDLIENLQFLKRKFVDTRMCHQNIKVGALEKAVIYDLLYWIKKSNTMEKQFISNINDALEFAWAHGQQFYNEIRNIVIKARPDILWPSYKVTHSVMEARYFQQSEAEDRTVNEVERNISLMNNTQHLTPDCD